MNEPNLGTPDRERKDVPSVPETPRPVEQPMEPRVETERRESSVALETTEAPPTSLEVAATERAVAPEAPAPIDATTVKVERILEDNLWDVYVGMPEDVRAAFKKLGEDTARAIRAQIVQAHIRASKIHALVHKWLKKIPGVNEWFLLQESKIKTDQFLKLATWIAHKMV